MRTLIVCVFIARAAWASDNGTTSGQFLNVGVGPRATAMGQAQVGLADDVYATYWNPAGLAQLKAHEAGFAQNQYVEGMSQQYATYAYPGSFGTFAGSFNFFNMGSFDAYDASGLPAGQVSAHDIAFALSFSRALIHEKRRGSMLALGATTRYIEETLHDTSSRAFAGDVGLLVIPGRIWSGFLDGWKGGLVVRNIGTALKFDRESYALPSRMDVGLSYTGKWRNEIITASLDGKQPQEGSPSFGAGLELSTLQFLILRTGYTSEGDWGNGLRWGAGIRLKTVQFDYAQADAGDLGAIHRVGITLRLGRLPANPEYESQSWFDKGVKNYRRRRYTEALIQFNKALEIDPSHPEALRMMKQSYHEIKSTTPD